ncbi:hypothetical protein BD410DRAFT_899756 [Rickenella mellea]|uniref:Uncharacterized protein n=1 Tax=Rickenella mellea TaxID=50990 RepID=A0A4Y7PZY6_9AGAM|nr:hypothetical protein BD410DRAFT_899756 [Rickenella mellea]
MPAEFANDEFAHVKLRNNDLPTSHAFALASNHHHPEPFAHQPRRLPLPPRAPAADEDGDGDEVQAARPQHHPTQPIAHKGWDYYAATRRGGLYILEARTGAIKVFKDMAREWEHEPDAHDTGMQTGHSEHLNASLRSPGKVGLGRPSIINASEHRARESQGQRMLRSAHAQGRVPLHETTRDRSGSYAVRTNRCGRRAPSFLVDRERKRPLWQPSITA